MGLLLIGINIIYLGLTISNFVREEADLLFWCPYLSFPITKTEHPILFRVAFAGQGLIALALTVWGLMMVL